MRETLSFFSFLPFHLCYIYTTCVPAPDYLLTWQQLSVQAAFIRIFRISIYRLLFFIYRNNIYILNVFIMYVCYCSLECKLVRLRGVERF